MASNNGYKGITLDIGGDTTQLGKALKDAETQLKSVQSVMKTVNSGLKMDSSSVALYTQKSSLLEKEIEAVEKKLQALRSAQDQVKEGDFPDEEVAKYNAELSKNEAYLKKLTSQLDENNQKIAELGSANEVAAAAAAKLAEEEEAAATKAATLGETMKASLSGFDETLKTLSDEMKEIEDGLELDPENTELLTQKTTLLSKEYETLNEKLKSLKSMQEQVNSGFDTAGNAFPEDEVRAYNREIANTESQMKSLNSELEETKSEVESSGSAWSKYAQDIDVAIAAVSATLIKLGKEAIQTGIEFESAFTGVAKTVDATDAELVQIRQSQIDLSGEIPITANELAGIAESAGQLGIANDYLMGFMETMANLGVATNMTSEQAATDFAKLANITGMVQAEFENLDSSIVALGNNYATTESDITSMATRMAAAGTQAGLSEAEILGFTAAASSLGIEAEAGDSALSKVFTMIQTAVETGSEDLSNYAEVAGMSSKTFAKAFEQDAAKAITAFVTGLGNVEKSGKSATVIIDELGITEVRLSNALKSLSGSGDLLTNAIKTSTAAWQENTALATEAETRYATMESKIQMLQNSFTEMGINAYESLKEPMEAGLSLVQGLADAAYDEYIITYNNSTDKISLYSTEYTEKIRLIDEATGAAIAGLNEEIFKELELPGIKTDGYADEIAAQQKIIDDNAAARAQEKIDDEDKHESKRRRLKNRFQMPKPPKLEKNYKTNLLHLKKITARPCGSVSARRTMTKQKKRFSV